MMKLKNLIKESQNLDYRRMNIGEKENEKGMTNEEKRAFLEAVASYHQFGEMISHKGNLSEIHENIKTIVENASSLTIKETGDWFDRVTVQRHMKSMNESYKVFSNSISEVVQLQQRLESAYDEIGEVLGKYYEIKEGNTFGAERAKAIAGNKDSFEVDGKSYKVTGVDAEDKENAEEFANESMKLTSLIKRNEELKGGQKELDVDGDGDIEADDLADLRAGKKADESINEEEIKWNAVQNAIINFLKMNTKILDKRVQAKDTDGVKGGLKSIINGLTNAQRSLKLESVSSVNEEKYTIIDPKGNSMGAAEKTQVMLAAKKKGGVQSGYFVVSAKNALKAKRALEKFKGDFRNPKLKNMMSNLFYESVNESHFKVGDKVKMSHGGVGVVKSLDKEHGEDDEKYYNVELPNGDVMKHAPNDLTIIESTIKEAKYDIGMARKGSGITVYNRAEEEAGDYKNIAHISDNGTVKYYDKKLPNDVKKKIEAEAQKMKESVNESNEFAGWVAIYNRNRIEIDKSEAKDLWGAKQIAIKKLNVPKSKQGLLAIKPAYNESKSFADPLEGFPQAYKDLLNKLQRSNDRSERYMLINKMNVIRKKLNLKPLKNESVNEGVKLSLVDPNTNKFIKTLSLDRTYKEAEKEIETLNRRLSSSEKTKGLYWKVTSIGESVNESHFQVGDKVKMSHGGVGVVKSLDKEDGADDEKYYGVQLPNGDVMKHAPNELKLVESQTKKASMLLKTLMDK